MTSNLDISDIFRMCEVFLRSFPASVLLIRIAHGQISGSISPGRFSGCIVLVVVFLKVVSAETKIEPK